MTHSRKPSARPWRSEIWRVNFPNRLNDPHLPRLVVVVSNDLRNEFSDSVLAIPISGDAGGRFLPTHVFLPKGTAGLEKDSRALCEQIASIDKACFVGGPMGKLGPSTMTALVLALNKAVEPI